MTYIVIWYSALYFEMMWIFLRYKWKKGNNEEEITWIYNLRLHLYTCLLSEEAYRKSTVLESGKLLGGGFHLQRKYLLDCSLPHGFTGLVQINSKGRWIKGQKINVIKDSCQQTIEAGKGLSQKELEKQVVLSNLFLLFKGINPTPVIIRGKSPLRCLLLNPPFLALELKIGKHIRSGINLPEL